MAAGLSLKFFQSNTNLLYKKWVILKHPTILINLIRDVHSIMQHKKPKASQILMWLYTHFFNIHIGCNVQYYSLKKTRKLMFVSFQFWNTFHSSCSQIVKRLLCSAILHLLSTLSIFHSISIQQPVCEQASLSLGLSWVFVLLCVEKEHFCLLRKLLRRCL